MAISPDPFAALATRFDRAVESDLLGSARIAADSASETAPEFLANLMDSVVGGKRLRAISAVVGALAVQESGDLADDLDERLLALGSALEFFQAAALVHDDVVDRSPLRRGAPAVHSALSSIHEAHHWLGEADHFGVSGAILIGDFLLSVADMTLARSASPSTIDEVRNRFALMTAEVAYGQYLDLRAAQTGLDARESLPRALQVVRFKSARYSVVHPVALGALSRSATPTQLDALESVFEPVGIAFQLRDDHLGVFGDPAATGKPVGSDLSERKRTALLALTFANADPAGRARLQEFYTAAQAPAASEIAEVSAIISHFGTEAHETMIADYRATAFAALESAGFSDAASEACWSLIDRLIQRES